MQDITVVKRNPQGAETFRYSGKLLQRDGQRIVIEAEYTRNDADFYGILLGNGDRFVETYFTDRWYNIYEIHAREDDHLRGWYCNISMPAQVEDGTLSWVDLALDLLVYPDGRQRVLDEDEFEQLEISPELRQMALRGLEDLKAYFTELPGNGAGWVKMQAG